MELHNGFMNYETWELSAWIENNEAAYNTYRQAAADALTQANGDEDEAARILANIIKTDIIENKPDNGDFYSELLTAELDDINYIEVAKSVLDE